MRFIVRRTSVWDDDAQPCPEAVKGTYTRVDARTFKSAKEHDEKLREPWLSRGTNHRKHNGGIARDFPGERCWWVEIATLDDLWAFSQEHGPVIVSEHFMSEDPSLEIYDGYRE